MCRFISIAETTASVIKSTGDIETIIIAGTITVTGDIITIVGGIRTTTAAGRLSVFRSACRAGLTGIPTIATMTTIVSLGDPIATA